MKKKAKQKQCDGDSHLADVYIVQPVRVHCTLSWENAIA